MRDGPDAASGAASRPMPWLLRLVWRVVLTGHVAAALCWLWMMPGGFPVWHPRFWANRAIPVVVLSGCVVGLFGVWRRRDAWVRLVVLGVPVGWATASITGRILFPISARWLFLAPLAAAVVLSAFAVWAWLGHRFPLSLGASVIAAAVVLGVAAPLSQRGSAPSTRPLNALDLSFVLKHATRIAEPTVELADGVRVYPTDGVVTARFGTLIVEARPMLRFWSRSPDRCWTLLAPRRLRRDPPWRVRHTARLGEAILVRYLTPSADLGVEPDGGAVVVNAFRALDGPVFSHLNTYCQLSIMLLGVPSLSFSPCPEARIEVTPFDYPFGRPARLAYLGADGVFRAVEARSAEKGPFRELAAGPLKRDEAISITVHDGGRPACRITFDDWAAQVSTEFSPTAGWGLPQNAIEFSLRNMGSVNEVAVYVTLAGTSVGRGWDSAGHAAGGYVNRMRIEPLPPPGGGDAKSQMPDSR